MLHKWSWFSGNSNILKFLLSAVRFTKCLGLRVHLRPPQKKKALLLFICVNYQRSETNVMHFFYSIC
jgi:hypothetical protein